jgi:hypothetical protein
MTHHNQTKELTTWFLKVLLSPDLKCLESGALEPFCKGHVVFMVYVMPGGASRGMAPLEPSGHGQRETSWRPRVSRDMVRSYV